MAHTPYLRSPANSLISVSESLNTPAPSESPYSASPSSRDVAPPSSTDGAPTPSSKVTPPSPMEDSRSPEHPTRPFFWACNPGTPEFPAQPPPPPTTLHTFASLSKKPAYALNCSCSHFNIHMQGNSTKSEVVTACVGQCCLDLISETVVDIFTKSPDYHIDFQDMVQVAVRRELLDITNNKDFTSNALGRRCITRTRWPERGSLLPITHVVIQMFSHLSTACRSASEPRSNDIEYTNTRTVNEEHFPYGIIPPDGVINRNLNGTFQDLVEGLPTRTVKLLPSVKATYIMPHAPSEPLYYWVPFGYAIGVFSNPDIYYSVWSGGRGSEGHEVFSLEEAFEAMEDALREGRFGLIH
ncbi:hypothetical protein CONPUDRAFT_152575 [Coniophora puteana RWD-64-598 SS2]|uniref:Uncharacterized protein n=1 Tax=Coniophora puteana (strain RWD-64-598) TaxID=741705 RepID=A0A5M3MR44_CONPW|nr:uncharacterized protein CONPUDRAFT_152575 [Coniophora puteana RWD-64-598 SS2]EIW81652.1 hypothetical protein CONPUDRAFT_152575 [Coniophora puteana RWD-64-598 SS2]